MTPEERRKFIALVCESPWMNLRARAAKALKRGGSAALEEAATLVLDAEFRDKIPAEDDFPEHLWNRLRKASHPLGWMPARRVAEEIGVPVWDLRSDLTGGCGVPATTPGEPMPHGPAPTLKHRFGPDSDTPRAFESITAHSNGRWDAAAFEFATPIQPTSGLVEALAEVFPPLAAERRNVFAKVAPAKECVQSLLHVAIAGGAYDCGSSAALGRLGAWRTIRWLVTSRVNATFDEVRSLALSGAWLRIDPEPHKWFENVAWDGCLACYVDDRVAVVAWTDTD